MENLINYTIYSYNGYQMSNFGLKYMLYKKRM